MKPQHRKGSSFLGRQTTHSGGNKDTGGEYTYFYEEGLIPQRALCNHIFTGPQSSGPKPGVKSMRIWLQDMNKPGLCSWHHSGNLYVERMWALETISSSSCLSISKSLIAKTICSGHGVHFPDTWKMWFGDWAVRPKSPSDPGPLLLAHFITGQDSLSSVDGLITAICILTLEPYMTGWHSCQRNPSTTPFQPHFPGDAVWTDSTTPSHLEEEGVIYPALRSSS